MSNTSTLSPYESSVSTSGSGPGIAAACLVGAVVGAGALIRWLSEETEDEKAAIQKDKADRRRENLAIFTHKTELCMNRTDTPSLSQINLHTKDMGSIVQCAEKLGYCIHRQPISAKIKQYDNDLVLLTNASGHKLAIERNNAGRLRLTTAGGLAPMQRVIRQHTLDRTLEHLKRSGMNVQTASLSNGEVQILAKDSTGQRTASNPEIKTRIHSDGTIWVDVDRVRGNHCESIVRGLAKAVGAEISGMNKKAGYFELPGEPAKTNVRV